MWRGRRDLNLRTVLLHNAGDAASSAAILAGALVIARTGWTLVDPLLGFAIGLAVLWSSGGIIRETTHILLEGTPRGLRVEEVARAMLKVPGVAEVHDIHIWSLAAGLHALSCHVRIEEMSTRESEKVLAQLNARLATLERQLRFLATQLPAEQAGRLQNHIEDYRATVRTAPAGDPAQIAGLLAKLGSDFQEISQNFDPDRVTFEEKLYWPVLASLGAVDVFFLTLAVLLLLLPLLRRLLPPAWQESWRTQALVVLLPAILFAGLRSGRHATFESLDYKGDLGSGAIASSLALFPPVPYGTNEDHLEDKYVGPQAAYWMGTDGNGRDLLTRMIWDSRTAVLSMSRISTASS